MPPRLDEHLGLFQAAEDLAVQESVARLAVEPFRVPALPGAARDPGERCLLLTTPPALVFFWETDRGAFPFFTRHS